jgi:uncharacterized delta-60 repeat protein
MSMLEVWVSEKSLLLTSTQKGCVLMRTQTPTSIDRLDRKKEHPRGVMVLTLIALLAYVSAFDRVQADDGDLDKSFGASGKVVTDFFGSDDEATAVAIQSDGKIIAVGSTSKPFVNGRDFALVRYNTDGTLDTTFGQRGKVATVFGSEDCALAVAIQQDGKIVAAGKHLQVFSDGALTGYHFAAARYNSDGSLDTSFGAGGKVTGDSGELDAIAIQNDGKIIVAGFTIIGTGLRKITCALTRYDSDGSIDAGFGEGGKVSTEFFSGDFILQGTNFRAVAFQPDGRIVAAGSAFEPITKRTAFALARYNDDGSLDNSFGSGGKVTSAILDSSGAMALAIHPNGKVVVAGFAGPKDAFRGFAVAHYNSDGSLDQSFGSGGTATSDFFPGGSVMRAVSFGPSGGIIAVGSVAAGAKGTDFAVARYTSDGSLDKRFGGAGKIVTELSKDEDDDAEAVAIQSDGQIIAVGATESGTDFALARYNTEQDFALAFDPTVINAERGTKVRLSLQIARKGGFAGNVTITHSDASTLKIKGMPDSISTTDATVSFKLKIKGSALTGAQQVTFTGKSDSGLERTTTLNMVIQ